MQKKFVVIDGSSLLYRAFYALPLLTTKSGQYTNAVYGFATMLVKLIGDLSPDAIAIAFDKGKKTFRNEMYADYKGTRKATPKELSEQIPLVHELADKFGIKLIEQAGYEADDIIGTLATKAALAGDKAIVITGDRDALQLIDDNITVMLTKKGISTMEMFDKEAFYNKYGLLPKALIDLKGLMGDSSDNIPGVAGVGEKTATKLLLEYQSVENILQNIDNISGKKLQERLRDSSEQAILSKKLATIVCDMDIDYASELFAFEPKLSALDEFCKRYEFRSVLRRLESLLPESQELFTKQVIPKFEYIKDGSKLLHLVNQIKEEGVCCFYPVFNGSLPQLELVGIAICRSNYITYIDSSIDQWSLLLEVLNNAGITKISHDIKRVYHAQISVSGKLFDTMLAAYVIDPADNRYALGELQEKYLGIYEKTGEFSEVAEAAVWAVDCINKLYPVLDECLVENSLDRLYFDIELPVQAVLAQMEINGICLDCDRLEVMSKEIAERIADLLQNIYELAGSTFNVNSPKQLGEVLFDKLSLPVIKKTKSGYSTDAEVLEKLRFQHPIIEEILEYRTLTKLKSTYLDGLLPLVNKKTGRIHTTFNQTVTATGRLSSSEPNLQNIPVRTEMGKKIRTLFVPGDGYDYLLSADYSQIELRVLAHMSRDKNFVEAFMHDQDVHTRTAAEVFGVPMAEVTSELRSRAKAVNFGIVYGISDYGLARDLNISRQEAGMYIQSYFEKCPGIKSFIDQTVKVAHENGYVVTLLDRRRYLPDINSSNYNQRSLAERMAMNTPIQGTAADIIKIAMISVDKALRQHKLRSRVLLQVHDELVLETVESEVKLVSEILRDSMENAVELIVPLPIDIHVGENWAQAK